MFAIVLAGLALLSTTPLIPPRASALAAAADSSVWYIDDRRGVIAHLPRDGRVSEYRANVEGWGESGLAVDLTGNVWFFHRDTFGRWDRSGRIVQYQQPRLMLYSLAIAKDGSAWFGGKAGYDPDSRGTIINVTRDGRITKVALTNGARAAGLVLDREGKLWFAEVVGDMWSGRIATLDARRHIHTIVSLDRRAPLGIALGDDGNIWFTTHEGFASINRAHVVRWFDWPQLNFQPGADLTAGPNRKLLVSAGWEPRIATIDMDGHVNVLENTRAYRSPATAPDGTISFIDKDLQHINALRSDGSIQPFRLPNTPPEPTFRDRVRAFWQQWAFLIVLVLPNIDSVICAAFALLLIRLNAQTRQRLINRLPMRSLSLTALIAGMTAICSSILATLAYFTLSPAWGTPNPYGASMAAGYALATGALLATKRRIGGIGVLNAIVAGAGAVYLAIAGISAMFVVSIIGVGGIALIVLMVARSETSRFNNFTGTTILSAGLLNGALGAMALVGLAVSIVVSGRSQDYEVLGVIVVFIPVAMLLFFVRGAAAAWTGARIAHMRRLPAPALTASARGT